MIDKPFFELQPKRLGAKHGIPINIPKSPTLGRYLLSGPTKAPFKELKGNQYGIINFTGPPGSCSQLYFRLVFYLPKKRWQVEKVDEWIEVQPTHKEYYERTMATKQQLEGVIKSGLASAAQSVSDYELVEHDLRKYKEVLKDFEEKDEHAIKAMFIDQVDIHTDLPNHPIALRTIVQRWPTIISDFFRLSDNDDSVDKIMKTLDVSRAEAVVLATKNKIYKDWKELFTPAVKGRYVRLKALAEARKKTIEEYKEWLKPYISRFRMTRLGGGIPSVRKGPFYMRGFADVAGQATFANHIRLWTWKFHKAIELKKRSSELHPKAGGFLIHPYDEWSRQNFILDTRRGLAHPALYPWLNKDKKHCPRCDIYYSENTFKCASCGYTGLEERKFADELVYEIINNEWLPGNRMLVPFETYYMFVDYDIIRLGTRLAVGELEDIVFNMTMYVMSHNVLLAKLLEIKCRELEFERYIEEILGIRTGEKYIKDMVTDEFPNMYGKKKEEPKTGLETFSSEWNDILKKFKGKPKHAGSINKTPKMLFGKPGPYETDFIERITKQYLNPSGVVFFNIVKWMKDQMGVF